MKNMANICTIPQNPQLLIIGGKGALTSAGYGGYVTVSISTPTSSVFINYTIEGSTPTCRPSVPPPSTVFMLFATAEVIIKCIEATILILSHVFV